MIPTRRRALLAVVAAVVLAGATACGAGGDGVATSSTLLPPKEFESAIAEPETVTINVHTPDEGSIPGTDLAIPFDQLRAREQELPPVSTPLAVYCRTGRMSAEAVQTLSELGYRDVVELGGGMVAWADSGRPIVASRG